MTKAELIILKQLNEIDDLKKEIYKYGLEIDCLNKRKEELETVLIEVKAIMLNISELKELDYKFIMQEIDRVLKE